MSRDEDRSIAGRPLTKAITAFIAIMVLQKTFMPQDEQEEAANAEQLMARCAGVKDSPACRMPLAVEREGKIQQVQVEAVERTGLFESNNRAYVLTASAYDEGGSRLCNLRIMRDFSYKAGEPVVTSDDCHMPEIKAADDEPAHERVEEEYMAAPTELVVEPATGEIRTVLRREPY